MVSCPSCGSTNVFYDYKKDEYRCLSCGHKWQAPLPKELGGEVLSLRIIPYRKIGKIMAGGDSPLPLFHNFIDTTYEVDYSLDGKEVHFYIYGVLLPEPHADPIRYGKPFAFRFKVKLEDLIRGAGVRVC